jgi:phosphatidylserine/phosphatidylglycerophosphate/cardiolipin synthase-like enzyme
MSVYKPLSRYSLLAVFAAVIVAGTLSLFERNRSGPDRGSTADPIASSALFSPAEDLEAPDIDLLNSATSTIDVAMYAFTDQRIEDSLAAAAKRGVKIRIYRDSLQLEDEEARASKRGATSTTDHLKTIPGIEIRVKARGKFMHLKSYCVDRNLLRTGSANWSPDGELAQDNDFYVIRDPEIVKKFESDFDFMWERSSNAAP